MAKIRLFKFNISIIFTLLLMMHLSLLDILPHVDSYFDSNKDNYLNSSYIPHGSIYIDGNYDFQVQATSEGWNGDGSVNNPYFIEGYSISDSGSYMIQIKNIDVYFVICNNLLDGTSTSGISFENVQHGTISKNTIKNCRDNGILIKNSNGIIILSNYISDCGPNDWNEGRAIFLDSSSSITVEANNLEYNKRGVSFGSTSYSYVLLNRIFNNLLYNIEIRSQSHDNYITSNTIDYTTGIDGIYLDFPDFAQYTYIYSNTISNSDEYGVNIDRGQNVRVLYNNFIDNYQYDDERQARNDDLFNYFDSNYWNDFVPGYQYWPDKYYIQDDDFDYNPSTTVYSLSTPTIISPNGGEMYSNSIMEIQWTSATDSHGYPISYDLFFSSNDGILWNKIASDLSGTTYEINSANFEDTDKALIKVRAKNTIMNMVEDSSNNNFIIHNELPPPTISYPNGGEILEEIINIQWSPSIDPYGHSVTYEVFYSDNDGATWISLISGLTENNYNWNTTTVPNGNNYLIKVNATCTNGATMDDISDGNFIILNHYLLKPNLEYPNGGEILSGVERVNWSAAIDTHGHDIFYTLYYSVDNGYIWILFAVGLSETYYDWDTSSLIDGTTYLLKVVASCSEGLFAEDISDGFFSIHNEITPPTIIFPNGGEVLQGVVTIQWDEAIDTMGHEIHYDLYYSINGGIDWNLIVSNLTSTSYNWNTSTVADSDNALIKVIATCSEGVNSEDVSDSTFTILNHILSPPIINFPNGGELLHGIQLISWIEANDSLGHTVKYDLFYSDNGGGDWSLLVSDLETTSWQWDTTTVPDGSNYLIKVVATCSEGLSEEDTSDSTFIVHNILPEPTIIQPDGGETIDGIYNIQWTEVVDPYGHSITYDLSFSANGGSSWGSLALGLTEANYDWDTTELPDGSNYLIKVVATCSEGAESMDISDNPFSILHHVLSQPIIIQPNGGETIDGIYNIQWTEAVDSYGHSITYNLSYSANGGSLWVSLALGLTEANYDWNTTELPDGNNYLIKVVATCSEGVESIDISDNPFSILHHILSQPIIIQPNGGEIIDGIYNIQWTEAVDSYGHSIIYNLSYSADGGTTWILLISGLTENNYDWDTTKLSDGTNYFIKVVATCSEGAESMDISDNPFSILHHILSQPIIIQPNGGETIDGIYNIQWTEAVDSYGHSITYILSYSADGGTTWILLISGLTENNYDWDTTELSDGSNYLIKVVATCSEGLSEEDTSDSTFLVDNIIVNNNQNGQMAISGYDMFLIIGIISVLTLLFIKKKK